jgi:hypothetical protein
MKNLALLTLATVPLGSAMRFINPALNSTIRRGSSVTLQWERAQNDPRVISILITNFVDFPPSYEFLATNVDVSKGEYTIRVPCATVASYGFRFWAIDDFNVYYIYAETPSFSVTGPLCNDPFPWVPMCSCTATRTIFPDCTLP